MKELTNKNDRCRVIMYRHMQENDQLTMKEKLDYRRLKSIYSDNHLYADKLSAELEQRGYLKSTQVGGPPSFVDQYNETVNPPYQVFKTSCTKEGLDALRGGLIKSETGTHLEDQFQKWSSFFISMIALVISIVACSRT